MLSEYEFFGLSTSSGKAGVGVATMRNPQFDERRRAGATAEATSGDDALHAMLDGLDNTPPRKSVGTFSSFGGSVPREHIDIRTHLLFVWRFPRFFGAF